MNTQFIQMIKKVNDKLTYLGFLPHLRLNNLVEIQDGVKGFVKTA